MAFTSNTRFVAKLNETPLIDEVSGNLFNIVGASSVSLLDGGLGYKMHQDQLIERDDISLQVGNKMTVGFWLQPTNPGQVRNPSSNDLEPLKISLLDIRQPTVNNDLILVLYEQTDPDGKSNTLRGIFYDLFGDTFDIVSSKYSADDWHHFWLVYDSPSSSVRLFIDGVEDSLTTTGTVPGGLNGGSAVIAINRLALSASFNVVNNQGIIDDLVVLNTSDATDATIQKVINHSLDFAFNLDYMNNEETDQSFLFSDPDAFHLTSVESDGTDILAARTDGKILEGAPLVWQSRKRFRDNEEVSSLDIFGSDFQLSSGFLEINGAAIVSV